LKLSTVKHVHLFRRLPQLETVPVAKSKKNETNKKQQQQNHTDSKQACLHVTGALGAELSAREGWAPAV